MSKVAVTAKCQGVVMKKTITVILLCLLIMSGCTEITYDEPTAGDGAAAVQTLPPSYPVTVGDLRFASSPERAVSLSPAITEIIFELGFGDRLVCRSDYCDYPEEALSLPSAGSGANPDISVIIAAAPDVVITQSPIANTDLARLRNAGISALILEPPDSLEELYSLYGQLAAIFAGETEGARLAEGCTTELKAALSFAKDSCESLVFILEVTTTGFLAATGDSFAGDYIGSFGENIAADGKNYRLTAEELAASDPQVIFLAYPLSADNIDAELADSLSAFENGYVYVIDSTLTQRPTCRLAAATRSIAEKIRNDTGGAQPSGYAVIESSETGSVAEVSEFGDIQV